MLSFPARSSPVIAQQMHSIITVQRQETYVPDDI